MSEKRVVLSCTTLRIRPYEYKALLEVREFFASGFVHHDYCREYDNPNGFNMDCILFEGECGTTGCLGGWMWAVMGRDRTCKSLTAYQYIAKERSESLRPLFYPDLEDIDDIAYDDITPGAALKAIDSFLATGNPNWPQAVGADHGEIEHA